MALFLSWEFVKQNSNRVRSLIDCNYFILFLLFSSLQIDFFICFPAFQFGSFLQFCFGSPNRSLYSLNWFNLPTWLFWILQLGRLFSQLGTESFVTAIGFHSRFGFYPFPLGYYSSLQFGFIIFSLPQLLLLMYLYFVLLLLLLLFVFILFSYLSILILILIFYLGFYFYFSDLYLF